MKRLTLISLLTVWAAISGAITLEESIGLAKQNNKALLMAREEADKADQTYYEVKSNLYPQIDLNGGYSLSKTYLPSSALADPIDLTLEINPLTASDNDYYLAGAVSGIINSLLPASPVDEGSLALSLQLQQVLYSGGKVRYGTQAMERFRQIQRQNLELKERELVLKTTQLFYSCLLADNLVAVQEEALGTARKHLQRVEAFSTEGMVADFDLLQAQLEIAKLEPQLLQAKNSRDLALAAFRTLIGTQDASVFPQGEFILPAAVDLTLDEAIQQGLASRPELSMAAKGSEIKELRWKIEKGNFLPTIGLQASAALYTAADDFSIEGNDFGTNYTIGIGLSMPLFNGFRDQAKRRSAKHDYIYSKLQQQDYEDMIRLEITQDYQKLRHAEENYSVQEKNIALAERGLQLAQVRYDNQVGIQLEVFDAQTTLSAIRLQYFQAIYEVISATRELQKAIGQVW